MTTDPIHRLTLPVYPHDTDYGGIVSHRAIVTWLEMARIDFVRSVGLEFAHLVASGFDLPVIELNVRYLRMVPFNAQITLLTQLVEFRAPRLSWSYTVHSEEERILHVTARSDHAIIDRERGKPVRRFPDDLEEHLRPLLVLGGKAD
ncbi:acyl-CoA thioesterase [Anthocerotibacter panamensis]|uniref:acyl-CoA thioesterase n=1 Tax=Anthocerotibacter panamensis TaxID=2857077 RepID=UPI001C406235|nr:thioesterase family protein [Anthocerotibacter panamensis]